MIGTFRKALLAMCGLLVVSVQFLYGQAKSHREAMGEENASEVEAVLRGSFPGATVVWDPQLAVQIGSQKPTPVDMAGFKVIPQPDGSLRGVTVFELGTAKKDYLAKIEGFAPPDSQAFPTTIVVFRIDSSHNLIDLKKFNLDLADPLNRIQTLSVQAWPGTNLPVLRIGYVSYFPGTDSVTMLEWHSLFDTAAGSLTARIPAGLVITSKNNPTIKEMEIFSVSRVDAGTVKISGGYTKKAISYTCGDPCMVDGPTFLSKWFQQ